MNEDGYDRIDRWTALGLFAGFFTVYALGACRTIYVGDSGELVTAVHVLGIPHPNGYPLYVLLGKLWTLIVPVGSIAFRMGLFSAACAAGTCTMIFVTARQEGMSRLAGLFGACLAAFGASFWHEANIPRVYALNALLLVLAINRAFAWSRTRRRTDLVLTMLTCGIGATNHLFMAFAGIAVAIWAPIVDRTLFRRPGTVALCGGAFLAGLLVYAYLPIRSRMNPVLNWGEPSTPERFLAVVLRRAFWHRAWWESPADLWPILTDFFKSLGPETGFAGLALAVIVFFVRPDRKLLLPACVVAMNVGTLALHGAHHDIFFLHRYYIPAYVATVLLATAGIDAMTQRGVRRAAWMILAVPAVMLALGWKHNDRSRYRFAEDYSRIVLDSIPPGATLVANDDNVLFVLLYLRYVEHLRPDVELIAEGVEQRKPDFFFDPDIDQVFFTHPSSWGAEGLAFAPRGLVIQAVRAGHPLLEPIPTRPLPGLDDPSIPRDFLTRALLSHYWFMTALTWEQRDWSRAEDAIRNALTVAPDYPLSLYNLGIIFARNGFYDEALRCFGHAEEINPRGLEGMYGNQSENRVLASQKIEETLAERDRIHALERDLASTFSPGIKPQTSSWHREMAARLLARGERAAARFHLLQVSPSKR